MIQVQLASPSIDADIRAFVEPTHMQQTGFLRELVKVPSNNSSDNYAPRAAHAKALLGVLGLTVEVHAMSQAQVRAVGMVSIANLTVHHMLDNDDLTVTMNAHGDIVSPGLDWTHGPYGGGAVETERGPTVFGRGVAVSKSNLATYTWALLTLIEAEKCGAKLNGMAELHFTCDRETGGDIGPRWLLDQGLSKPDYAISAGFAYGITSAHNRRLYAKVTVRSKQTHAVTPHAGIDATKTATYILRTVCVYHAELATRTSSVPGIDHVALNVGLIQGGINTNIVSDLVTFRANRRMVPEETGRDAESELCVVIEHATAERPGIEAAVERVLLAQPSAELPGVGALVGALRRSVLVVLGGDVPVHDAPLYTDARHYTTYGMSTALYSVGPRTLMKTHGYSTDEDLWLNDLWGATMAVGYAVGELSGG